MAQVFVNSMSSANSLVTFDLGGVPFDSLMIQVPTFASTANLDLYVAVASNATYFQLRQPIVATGTTQNVSFSIAANVSTNGGVVPLANFPFQFFRIKADSAPTTAVDFKVICSKAF